jgi:HlyD family secretion protein
MHPNPRRIAPVVLLVLLVVAAGWLAVNFTALTSNRASAQTEALSASGTIEATQVTIAPELNGRLVEVLVQEGDPVHPGQVLARFDDSLLKTQISQARAQLAQAQANYTLVAAGPTVEQRQAAITAAELEVTSAQQSLDALHDNAKLVDANAQKSIADAEKALDMATQRLDSITSKAEQVDIDAAQAEVVLAKKKLDTAKKNFEPYENKSKDNTVRAMFQARLADAQKKYDALVERLNNLLGTANSYDLAVAEANKSLAQSQVDDAHRQSDKLQDGLDPDTLKQAKERLAAAQAQLELAKAGPSAEQLALAKSQVDTALASVDVLQAQLDKLEVKSPIEGVVLSRSAEPGEVAMPGTPLLTLARLDDLTITVYIPEDRYGAITLGENAQVTVDSFPGTTFPASVVHIADQAEFTPRNVQTAEGRRTTVFAIKLAVNNAEGRLKPGMPADVVFGK